MLEGDRPPRSLPISSSSSLPSKQRPLLFTLTSELALLLVPRGESETLIVLLRVGPDLTLYIDDAGIFVINGRRLPGMLLLISCCKNLNQKNNKPKSTLIAFNFFYHSSTCEKNNKTPKQKWKRTNGMDNTLSPEL